jgi:hypothetical protein
MKSHHGAAPPNKALQTDKVKVKLSRLLHSQKPLQTLPLSLVVRRRFSNGGGRFETQRPRN